MIIDVHTHTPQYRGPVPPDREETYDKWRPDRPVRAVYNWEDHLAAMTPVDRAIVFPIAWSPGSNDGGVTGTPLALDSPAPIDPNEATAEFVRAHPDKLIGFMSIHPYDPKALARIDSCVRDLGLRGIKLAANYQNFDPLEDRALAIYERAQSLGLPVLFHQGTSPVRTAPIRLAHPLIMDQIAIRYPELRIIMAHMGHPWQVDTIAVIRKHPHVYADISGLFYRPFSFYECLLKCSEWGAMHKLLLASDFPIATPDETITALRNVNQIVDGTRLPKVPDDQIEAIIHRDSLALLGLA
ncbi:amidohydrolase family protein [Roseiflexus castenholzii]|uniref:amidohydrolase family protein n=1 Tax=Roseiflexus castenholzii TaxID=120962 RepID=UPI003C7D2AC9